MVVLCSWQSIPPPSQASSSSSSSSNASLLTPRRAIILSYPAIGLAMASLSIFNTLPSLHHANATAFPGPEQLDDPQQEEARLVRIFQEASPSVVCIKDLEVVKNTKSSSFIGDGNAKEEGTGSGFIWDKFGHIVTNYHVVEKLATDKTGAQRCKVILADAFGNNFVQEGKIIGFDVAYDLAVLKVDVDGHQIKPAIIGSSHDLRVGQDCFAIGNPYGYENTLTTGVVSGLGREIPSPNGGAIRGAVQTDAAINSGNSGGPLINSYGHVIGVNTATFTRKGTGTSSGVNFAIPIDSVVKTVPYLIVYGTPYSDRY